MSPSRRVRKWNWCDSPAQSVIAMGLSRIFSKSSKPLSLAISELTHRVQSFRYPLSMEPKWTTSWLAMISPHPSQ